MVAVAVAAAVVMALGLAGTLTRTNDTGGHDTATKSVAGPGPTSASAANATDSPIEGGDLGEIKDAGGLAAISPGPAGDNPVVGAPAQSAAGPVAKSVGTRACELQARALEPAAGPVVYVATASQNGAPATVLGFSPPGGGRPISLFLMAQDGCRLLARATVP